MIKLFQGKQKASMKRRKNEVQRKEAGMKFLYEIRQGGQHVPRFPSKKKKNMFPVSLSSLKLPKKDDGLRKVIVNADHIMGN